MTKQEFVDCATSLRNYWNWENEIANKGINFSESPIGGLADTVLELLTKGAEDWGFDSKIGMNWIVIWCSAPYEQQAFGRGSQWITIAKAEDLWDFINEMNELGWHEQIENWRWL